jgi:hypothetical protein
MNKNSVPEALVEIVAELGLKEAMGVTIRDLPLLLDLMIEKKIICLAELEEVNSLFGMLLNGSNKHRKFKAKSRLYKLIKSNLNLKIKEANSILATQRKRVTGVSPMVLAGDLE